MYVSNGSLEDKYRIRKFVSGSWVDVGIEYSGGNQQTPTNIQVASDGTVYLCKPVPKNDNKGIILKQDGSGWTQTSIPFTIAANGIHFFRIGSDGHFYVNAVISSSFCVLKDHGSLWIPGDPVFRSTYQLSDLFLTSDLTAFVAGYSYRDYIRFGSFVFDPKSPSLTDLSLSISGKTEITDTLALGQKLQIKGHLVTGDYSSLKAVVFDAYGKRVAELVKTDQLTGNFTFEWLGKATEGNEAGLPAGEYVPWNGEGVEYSVKLYVESGGGNTESAALPLKVTGSKPVITSQNIHTLFYLGTVPQSIGDFKVDSWLPVTAQVFLYDIDNRLAARYTVVQSRIEGASWYFSPQWDSKVTVDNELGLPEGSYVPATETGISYTCVIELTNTLGETEIGPVTVKIKKQPPKIISVSLLPDINYSFGGSDQLYLSVTMNRYWSTIAEIVVRNFQGQSVSVVRTQTTSGTQSFAWDGKATAGNEAGLTAGDYVPATPEGTDYTIQVRLFNDFGESLSQIYPFKAYCEPPVPSISAPPNFTATGTNRYEIGSVSSTVPVRVTLTARKTEDRQIVSTQLYTIQPSAPTIFWDCKATPGNEAGLPAGIVPNGDYTIEATLANCAGEVLVPAQAFSFSSSDILLSSLAVQSGETIFQLSPAFSSGVTDYTVSVPDDVLQVSITAQPDDINAGISYPTTVNLAYGSNPVSITVTAQDGVGTGTVSIDIVRMQSDDCDLDGFGLSTGTLSPAFSAGIMDYEVTLPATTTSLTVTPQLSDVVSTMTIDGAAVSISTVTVASDRVKVMSITVTAQNGGTKTYRLYITRNTANYTRLADLRGDVLQKLSPAFSPYVYTYTLSLGESDASAMICVAKPSPNAQITIDGSINTVKYYNINNGQSIRATIQITYGGTTRTYSVTITRAKSSDATLRSINTSYFKTFTPQFDPQISSYTAVLDQGQYAILHPLANSSFSRIYINGVRGDLAEVAVDTGATRVFTIKVVAQSGASKTYKVTIYREKSTDTSLFNLSDRYFDGLNPSFRWEISEYNLDLPEKANGFLFKPQKNNKFATFRFDGVAAQTKFVAVPYGSTKTLTLTVVAQAGNTRDYTIHLRRPAHLSAFTATPKPLRYPELLPGGTNTMTFSYNLAGNAEVSLGVVVGNDVIYLFTRTETSGAKTFVWDGKVEGVYLPAGRYKAMLQASYEGMISSYALLVFEIKPSP